MEYELAHDCINESTFNKILSQTAVPYDTSYDEFYSHSDSMNDICWNAVEPYRESGMDYKKISTFYNSPCAVKQMSNQSTDSPLTSIYNLVSSSLPMDATPIFQSKKTAHALTLSPEQKPNRPYKPHSLIDSINPLHFNNFSRDINESEQKQKFTNDEKHSSDIANFLYGTLNQHCSSNMNQSSILPNEEESKKVGMLGSLQYKQCLSQQIDDSWIDAEHSKYFNKFQKSPRHQAFNYKKKSLDELNMIDNYYTSLASLEQTESFSCQESPNLPFFCSDPLIKPSSFSQNSTTYLNQRDGQQLYKEMAQSMLQKSKKGMNIQANFNQIPSASSVSSLSSSPSEVSGERLSYLMHYLKEIDLTSNTASNQSLPQQSELSMVSDDAEFSSPGNNQYNQNDHQLPFQNDQGMYNDITYGSSKHELSAVKSENINCVQNKQNTLNNRSSPNSFHITQSQLKESLDSIDFDMYGLKLREKIPPKRCSTYNYRCSRVLAGMSEILSPNIYKEDWNTDAPAVEKQRNVDQSILNDLIPQSQSTLSNQFVVDRQKTSMAFPDFVDYKECPKMFMHEPAISNTQTSEKYNGVIEFLGAPNIMTRNNHSVINNERVSSTTSLYTLSPQKNKQEKLIGTQNKFVYKMTPGIVLVHPDEFRNPSSFLKVYGDPLCGTVSSITPESNGNWTCEKCMNINYPRRVRCNKCDEVRDSKGDVIVNDYVLYVYKQHLSAYKKCNSQQRKTIKKSKNNSAST